MADAPQTLTDKGVGSGLLMWPQPRRMAERSLLLLLPVSEHIAQRLVVQVACRVDGRKLEHLIDLAAGWGVRARQGQGGKRVPRANYSH